MLAVSSCSSIFNLKSSIFNVDSFNLTLASGHGNPSRPAQVVGRIRSALRSKDEAPRRGSEGAPDAWLDVDPAFAPALRGVAAGDEVIVITWLHRGDRESPSRMHPRGDPEIPIAGVFAARSPDRPNPLGLHRVTVREISGTRLRIGPIEAIDGTPVLDIKRRCWMTWMMGSGE